jgi:hypothetical protein
VAWQGWVALVAYFVLLLLGSAVLVVRDAMVVYLVYAFVLTVGLIALCWVKGERPRWRWGGDDAPVEPPDPAGSVDSTEPLEPD